MWHKLKQTAAKEVMRDILKEKINEHVFSERQVRVAVDRVVDCETCATRLYSAFLDPVREFLSKEFEHGDPN